MIDFLKKHNKKIEFVLLFLPLLFIYFLLLDDEWIGLSDYFDVFTYLPIGSDGRTIVLGSEFMDLITWFMPFILWKVISKYWLR